VPLCRMRRLEQTVMRCTAITDQPTLLRNSANEYDSSINSIDTSERLMQSDCVLAVYSVGGGRHDVCRASAVDAAAYLCHTPDHSLFPHHRKRNRGVGWAQCTQAGLVRVKHVLALSQ